MPIKTPSPPLALERMRAGLVVSVQARGDSPLRDERVIVAIAASALSNGAVGLRLDGPEDISAMRARTDCPIIGLYKVRGPARNLITPTIDSAREVVLAGADVVALEATVELHGTASSPVAAVRRQLGVPVMADVSTLDEGVRAWDEGADVVGTTLSGYTPQSRSASEEPDIALVERLAAAGVRVIAEGRYRTPDQARLALEAGAWAVVVGGAISDPGSVTRRFSAAFADAAERMR